MNTATLNQPVFNFDFTTTENPQTNFAELLGKIVVLYFYPKDNTPGCTQEAKDFRDLYSQFLSANACILGVSRDSLKSHHKFKTSCGLPFPLICDDSQTLCHYFEVIKEKSMMGKKYLGIERSTFLIDQQGVLCQEWRNVKVSGHAQAVLQAVRGLARS